MLEKAILYGNNKKENLQPQSSRPTLINMAAEISFASSFILIYREEHYGISGESMERQPVGNLLSRSL